MDKQIDQYEPQMEIILFDGSIYYIPITAYAMFKKTIERDRFVELQGALIATSTIKIVRQSKYDDLLRHLPQEQKRLLLKRCMRFEQKLDRYPTRTEVQNMIIKYCKS